MNDAKDLALLIEVAREAGEIALGYWRDDPQVWDKGGDDPVSEADLAVDRHIRARLLGARPDYAWISEETEDDLSRLSADRVFICDPIDGTRSFVAGERSWAHSLAVASAGAVTAACVFLPAHGRLYAARRGAGATLSGRPIATTGRDALDGATVVTPRVTMRPEFWSGDPPPVERVFRPSLAYRLCLVAEGRFDAMLTLRPAWEWDIAAGALIAAEAGAKVSDRKGQPLIFNGHSRQTAGVVAAGPALHTRLLERLA